MSLPRLGVLVSGGGTTLANLLRLEQQGTLEGRVVSVISSSRKAGAMERARAASIPAVAIPWSASDGGAAFDARVAAELDRHEVDLVLLAGFLRLWRFPERFRGRVLNIHPALLPAFGGAGMFGMKVHQAVVASGVKVTGCTVHFADHRYDRGPILLQKTCPVRFEDQPEDVARRVFALECEAYPEAVRLWARGRVHLEGDRVRVDGE